MDCEEVASTPARFKAATKMYCASCSSQQITIPLALLRKTYI